MKYRKLGKTGIDVSEIGFGAWGIGGVENGAPAYGPADDGQSIAALNRALDLGVNFFDTSDLYGDGHSECLIGETFRSRRDQVVIATKVGFVASGEAQDFSPKHIKESLEASLKRLKTDYVDLYQLHSPPIDLLTGDDSIFSALTALEKQGKVRACGVSAISPQDGISAIKGFGFKTVQVNFNLLDQRAVASGLFDLSAERDVAIIARTPFSFGFLTGAYASDATFPSSDHRSSWSPEQIERWVTGSQQFASALSSYKGQTKAQLALRYCLSYPSVTTVIPGMMTKREVEENVPASQLGPLSETEIRDVENIYNDNSFFVRG